VLHDARLYVEIKTGYAITFLFATDEAIALWPPITLPNLPEFVQKANDMMSRTIGLNLEFIDVAGSLQNAV
jgi:hypothetical protein